MRMKDEIINELDQRVSFCICDCNTFLFAKTISEAEEYSKKGFLGGGNYTVLAVTLACLDLLSSIYYLATCKSDEKCLWSEEESRELEELENDLYQRNSDVKKLKGFIRIPQAGELKSNFKDRFAKLMKDTRNIHNLTDDQINKLYKIRNKMLHTFNPKFAPAAALPFNLQANFLSLVTDYKTYQVFHSTAIDSNALNHKLLPILNFVVDKLGKLTEARLEIISNWLEEN
jgi:hypothetical protein